MDLDHLLFCANHPEKIAKRHCNKCNQDICNECVFDLHIEHHPEITKINYIIDNRSEKFTYTISEEIKEIINKSLEALKPQICQIVLDKTKEYINTHKNLQLKASVPMDASERQPNYVRASERAKQSDSNKANNIKSSYSSVANMTKIFDNNFAKENARKTMPTSYRPSNPVIQEKKENEEKNENSNVVSSAGVVKSYDKLEDANPFKNGAKGKGVKGMASIFEGNKY